MKYKILIIVTAVILVSCKTTRSVTKPAEKPKVNDLEQVVANVQKAQPNFNTANINKMSIQLQIGEREVNVSASCKVKKDSLIHISVQPFMGIEMFKAEFTTDSIRLFDKMNKRLYVVDYSFLKKKLGIDVNFSSLQSLIFNQYFCVNGSNSQTCTLTSLDGNRSRIDCENSKLTQSTEITADYNVKQMILKSVEKPYQLTLNYDDYAEANGVRYPQKVSVNVANGTSTASSIFSILKVEFNVPVKFSSTNPERYTRSDIDQLLRNNK